MSRGWESWTSRGCTRPHPWGGARGPQKATCDPKARQLCWALWGRHLFCYTRLSFQGSERSAESQVHFQTWLDLSLPFLPQKLAVCGARVTSLCQCLGLGHLMLIQLYSLSMRFYFLVWMGHTHVTKDFQPFVTCEFMKSYTKEEKKNHISFLPFTLIHHSEIASSLLHTHQTPECLWLLWTVAIESESPGMSPSPTSPGFWLTGLEQGWETWMPTKHTRWFLFTPKSEKLAKVPGCSVWAAVISS